MLRRRKLLANSTAVSHANSQSALRRLAAAMLDSMPEVRTFRVASAAISRAIMACRPAGHIAVSVKLVSSQQCVDISGAINMSAAEIKMRRRRFLLSHQRLSIPFVQLLIQGELSQELWRCFHISQRLSLRRNRLEQSLLTSIILQVAWSFNVLSSTGVFDDSIAVHIRTTGMHAQRMCVPQLLLF